MNFKYSVLFVSCVLWSVTACTTVRPSEQAECLGTVMEVPPGLVEVNDPALLREALGKPGAGRLCTAKVFRADYPLTLYRVWDAKADNQYGRWWSFLPPQGPRESYRAANAICDSFSHLDRVSTCTLKVGAVVVIGPGQSVQCDDKEYAKSAVNQVYVHNERDKVLVDNCISAVKWPPPLQ